MTSLAKKLALLCAFLPTLATAQTPTYTPNISLQVPAYGQQNWQVPLNYDLNLLDRLLSGNSALPALSVTGQASFPQLTTWQGAPTSYPAGAVVVYLGTFYASLSNGNSGNLPTNATYWTTNIGSGSGITSLTLNVPAWLTSSCGTGSPLTGPGACTIASASTTQNQFLASPSGTNGALAPRAIVPADLPVAVANTSPGIVEPDGTSIVMTGNKISAVGGSTITVEHIFAAAGTYNYAHNLSSLYPLASCYSKSGASTFSLSPVSSSAMAVTVPGASDLVCAFAATAPLAAGFNIAVSPSTYTYFPTLVGTQTPTFAITQTASGGYTNTVTYSCNSLASGMSCAYSPATIGGSGTSTLGVSFPWNQASGLTTFNVSGTDGTLTNSAPVALTISDINQNLLAGYAIGEASGTTFDDSTTNAANATVTGSGAWGTVAGLPGTSYVFNGTGDATASNDTATNFDGSQSFSVSFWMYATGSPGFLRIVGNLNGGSTLGWLIQLNTSGGINMYYTGTGGDSQGANTSTNLIGGLHYVVCTYTAPFTAGTYTIWVDGVQATTFSASLSGSMASGTPISIGGGSGSYFFNGTIKYLRIVSGVLSGSDIAANYAAGPR